MLTQRAWARIGIVGALLFAASSAGYARSDARTLTCAAIQALLQRDGSAVLSTGANTYDRYVSGQSACIGTEVARARSISTSDGQCQVFRCENRIRGSRR
jgi:hypothetical protein